MTFTVYTKSNCQHGTRTIDSWGGYRPDKIKELASIN